MKLEDLRKAARGEEEDDEDALASLPKPPPVASVEEAEWIKSVLPSPQLPEWEKLPLVDSAPTPQELFKLMAELGQPVTAMNIDSGFVECVRKALQILWDRRDPVHRAHLFPEQFHERRPIDRRPMYVGIDRAAPGSERTVLTKLSIDGRERDREYIRAKEREAEAFRKSLFMGEFIGEKEER